MTFNSKKHLALSVLIVFGPLILLHLAGHPKASIMALFISIVLLWFTELVPLAATGLLVPVLAVLYGVTDVKSAFLPFGNQILFLFIGSFLLAGAMQKHAWDKRMAYTVLASRWVGESVARLIILISIICWVLSMWISNTATCAIVTPMCLGILETLRERINDEQCFKNLSIRLLLLCAFASSIGGMATPVGSPPNLLAIQFLSNKGIHIDFFGWMLFGIPISICMLLALHFILAKKYPVKTIDLHDIRNTFTEKLNLLGKIKSNEIQVAICFFMAVFFWVLPGFSKLISPDSTFTTVIVKTFPMGIVALLASLILFFLPTKDDNRNLDWNDAKKIDWGIILIFGGGLCLGNVLDASGLAADFGKFLFAGGLNNIVLTGATAILAGILISEFSSNTASTTIIVPILMASFLTMDPGTTKMLVIASTFGASFGFMLPVSTPPNAIVYGTGRIPLRQMVKTGVFFDITGFALIFIFVLFIFPKLGLL